MRRTNLPVGIHPKLTWRDNTETYWYISLRRLCDVPLRRFWVFHLILIKMSWRRTNWKLLLRPLETFSQGSNMTLCRRTTETSWQYFTETSLGVSFETYLRRCWDVQRDVIATSPCHLVICRVLTMKYKDKKPKNKNLVVTLLDLILVKKTLIFLKLWMNPLINWLKNTDKQNFNAIIRIRV